MRWIGVSSVAEPKREEDKITSIDVEAATTSGDDLGPAGEKSEAAKLRAERDELLQTMVRRQADFENYRKRVERDRQEEARRGVGRLITDVVPVLDAFDQALKAHDDPAYEEYRKGVTLIRKQLWDTLARHGVQRIEAAGKPFDPNVHQAIERIESADYPDGLVLDVFQDGYLFHGRVLRPAIVRVVVHPSGDTGEDSRLVS